MADVKDDKVAKIAALLNPRNVVIVGASDRNGSWSTKVFNNLTRYRFPGGVYSFNPSRNDIWGGRCFQTFDELPEPPDHLLVLIPAASVPEMLRRAARAGARSATIMSSGFEEIASEQSQAVVRQLRAVIDETGMAISGPNCLGNFVAKNRLITIADDRPQRVAAGPVAIVAQSGGLPMAIKRTLEDRGMDCGYMITSGNETALSTGDYIRYFADDPDTRVIVSYLESIHEPAGFLDACRRARDAGKPVIVVKLGASNEGREAALAHTGALAGPIEIFDAVAGPSGVIRARTLDDVVELTEYFLHAPLPKGPGLGSITFSGGLRGMMLDAAANNGLKFSALSPATRTKLNTILSVGSIVGNPLDAGFTALSSQRAYLDCIEALLDDPGIDVLLLQEELPRVADGFESKGANLRAVEAVAKRANKPIAYVTMISHGLTEYGRQVRAELPHLPFLQEPDKALRTIRSIATYVGSNAHRHETIVRKPPPRAPIVEQAIASANGQARALSEVDSKLLLRAYGIRAPQEAVVASPSAAATAARALGFPVVLKAVSTEVTHKSDAGAVLVGLDTAQAVKDGFNAIIKNVRKHAKHATVDAMLVAQQVTGGLELVLGSVRDPEMGPVIMFGTGGTAVEMNRDVAFAAPLTNADDANALIDRTNAGQLLNGFRGGLRHDRKAVVAALLGLSRLVTELRDVIDSVDINPFVALPKAGGGLALDALVILRRTH